MKYEVFGKLSKLHENEIKNLKQRMAKLNYEIITLEKTREDLIKECVETDWIIDESNLSLIGSFRERLKNNIKKTEEEIRNINIKIEQIKQLMQEEFVEQKKFAILYDKHLLEEKVNLQNQETQVINDIMNSRIDNTSSYTRSQIK